jgi:WD40 repeat protein
MGRTKPVEPAFHLVGHSDGVHEVAFSPDGKRIITASHDGTARLWDAASGKELHVLEGHDGAVFGAAFSDTGERVATGGADGKVLVWDAEDGELLAMLDDPDCFIYGVAFAPDGSVLGVGQDGTLRRWDVEEERQTWAIRADGRGITSIAVSPDGKLLATGSGAPAVAVWDLSTGRLRWRQRIPLSEKELNALFERQRREGEGTGAGGGAQEGPSRDPGGIERPVSNLAFAPDNASVYTQSFYSAVLEWDAATGRLLTYHDPGVGALALDVSSDGKLLLISGSDGLHVWKENASPLELVARLKIAQPGNVHDAAFSPDGRFAALAQGGAWVAGSQWRSAGATAVPVWDLGALKSAMTSPAATSPGAAAGAGSGPGR